MPAPKGHPAYPNCKGLFIGGRDKKYTKKVLDDLADELLLWLEDAVINDHKKFWWKDWCFLKGFSPSRIIEWAKENERFAVAYHIINEWQESTVCKYALLKKLDSSFSKFYLSAKHGWREKDEEAALNEKANELYNRLMIQLENVQSSALKIEDNSNNADTKS